MTITASILAFVWPSRFDKRPTTQFYGQWRYRYVCHCGRIYDDKASALCETCGCQSDLFLVEKGRYSYTVPTWAEERRNDINLGCADVLATLLEAEAASKTWVPWTTCTQPSPPRKGAPTP